METTTGQIWLRKFKGRDQNVYWLGAPALMTRALTSGQTIAEKPKTAFVAGLGPLVVLPIRVDDSFIFQISSPENAERIITSLGLELGDEGVALSGVSGA